MRRVLLLGTVLLLGSIGLASAQNTGVNPIVGSVWTYLGATYGAGWAVDVAGARHVPSNLELTAASTALFPLGVWRDDYAVGLGAPPLWYRPSNAPCTLNGGNGDNGSQVKSSDGKCWLAAFPTGGVDIRQFGADMSGVADSAPAINAALALGSYHRFVFAPGTYLINSLTNTGNPYPTITGQAGIHSWCPAATPCVNIEIAGEGAVITTGNAVNNSNWMALDYWQHFHIHGLSFKANLTGISSGEPSAIVGMHLTDGTIDNISMVGDWGSPTAAPVFFAGDALLDVTFRHIDMGKQSLCFDVAFLIRVTFSDITARGSNGSGGPSPTVCFNIIYDQAAVTNYPTAFPANSVTAYVVFDNSVDVSNFVQGALIAAGEHYTIAGGFHDNPGTASNVGVGVVLLNSTSGAFPSTTDPITDVKFVGGQFNNNGLANTGGGIWINGAATNAGEGISKVLINGNIIDNNTNRGVITSGPNVSGLVIGGNTLGGLAQTTDYDATTLTLLAKGSASSSVAIGCAQSFNPATALTQYCSGQVLPVHTYIGADKAGVFANLVVVSQSPPAAGHTYTFYLRTGGVDTPLGCAMTSAIGVCSDFAPTHAVPITQGAGYELKMVADAAAAGSTNLTWSMTKFAP